MSSLLKPRSDLESESSDHEQDVSAVVATILNQKTEVPAAESKFPSDEELKSLQAAIEEDEAEREAQNNSSPQMRADRELDEYTDESEIRRQEMRTYEETHDRDKEGEEDEEEVMDIVRELQNGISTNINELLGLTSEETLEEWAKDPSNDFINGTDEESVNADVDGIWNNSHSQWALDQSERNDY